MYFLLLLPFSVVLIHRAFLWFCLLLYHLLLKILPSPASSDCHSYTTTAAVQLSFFCSSS